MAETVLFSQFIGNVGETDCLYIRLSADTEVSLNSITPIRLEMGEMFTTSTPSISFEFTDGNGDLVNHNKPSMSSTYFLDIGNTPINATRIELRCTKVVLLNQRAGSSEQVAFKMFFVHKSWGELVNKRRNRAWLNAPHSQIVSEIVGSLFPLTDIPTTDSIPEFFVQPYWSDIQAIRYVRNKSISPDGGHMEFGVTLEGKFIFKSTGSMINSQKVKAKNKEIPVFRMEGQIGDEALRKENYDKNKAPTYFMNYTAEEEYTMSVSSGGGGVIAMYFDTSTGQYVTTPVKYSDAEAPQMSDWASVQAVDENSGMRIFGGRDSDVIAEANNLVVDTVDSINRFEIVTERAPLVHIGDMVEVIIPTPPSIGSIVPQNIFYSGFYLVCGVFHVVNFNKSTVTSTISLMREGFDGKQLAGYTRSKQGKFI